MKTIPISLALVGMCFLACEIRSFTFVRRILKTGRLSKQWRRHRNIAFLIGALLVMTIPWQQYPLGNGTAAGVPFFAAWYDNKGRDFVGAITLPALLGDVAVWFLVPQLVLAYILRRHLSSHHQSHTNAA